MKGKWAVLNVLNEVNFELTNFMLAYFEKYSLV
jgi:hypothetical protein